MTPEHAKEAQDRQIIVLIKTPHGLERPAIITLVHDDRADVYSPAYGMQKFICMSIPVEDISYIPIHWQPEYTRFLYHVFGLTPPENRPTREHLRVLEGGRKPRRGHLRLIQGGKA